MASHDDPVNNGGGAAFAFATRAGSTLVPTPSLSLSGRLTQPCRPGHNKAWTVDTSPAGTSPGSVHSLLDRPESGLPPGKPVVGYSTRAARAYESYPELAVRVSQSQPLGPSPYFRLATAHLYMWPVP
jgi:hypothetical protein